ncbi:MAG: DUF937 domain-containing protein [Acidobacteriota bacterium]|nr:DUF937 domain-containing protein [Acidobacteriota bacterium]
MFSLQDLLGQQQGEEAVGQISQQIGADPSSVQNAIQMALPAILGGLAQKAQQPETAPVIASAIEQEQGGFLDNLGGLFGGSAVNPMLSAGILSTIVGNNQTQVASQIGQKSGLSTGQVASILMLLAPIVLGYLGRRQTQQRLDQGGIFDMLNGYGQQAQQQPQTGGWLSGMLDANRNGSSLDELAAMAMQYMGRR